MFFTRKKPKKQFNEICEYNASPSRVSSLSSPVAPKTWNSIPHQSCSSHNYLNIDFTEKSMLIVICVKIKAVYLTSILTIISSLVHQVTVEVLKGHCDSEWFFDYAWNGYWAYRETKTLTTLRKIPLFWGMKLNTVVIILEQLVQTKAYYNCIMFPVLTWTCYTCVFFNHDLSKGVR